MKKVPVKLTALFMVLLMTFSVFTVAVSAEDDTSADAQPAVTAVTGDEVREKGLYSYLTDPDVNPDEISNSVVIPGVFQSKTRLYNEDGTEVLKADGSSYSAPFYLDETGDIVKLALRKCLFPLLLTLFTQHDFGGLFVKNVSETICSVLGEKIKSDSQGKLVYDVRADKYNDCAANLPREDVDFILDAIPLNDYAAIAGEDHLYFFSYCSFGNIDETVDELYELIVKAANASPTGKANIIPISQGGSLANNLLERHKDVGQYLDRIVYIVPALDGTVILGDIYANGIIDDDEALYNETFPILLGEDTGSLVNVVLRLLPNKVVNDLLDATVDTLIEDYIKYCTCMWALVDSSNYPTAADKYLDDPEDAYIRAQTDAFYQAQLNSKANITYQMETYGVKVFDVVDYNYALYPICDSWKTRNADGVINSDSTSIGATFAPVDSAFPDGYVPAKGSQYIDKYNMVDAGTGLLPDTTFYFHNQSHEKTAQNDVIIKLAICLITDNDFTSVNSYPEKFPQFNEERAARKTIEALPQIKAMDTSKLSDSEKAEFAAAIENLEAVIANTVVDSQAFYDAKDEVYKYVDKINGKSSESSFGDKVSDAASSSFATFMVKLSNFLYKVLGGKGFSDIFRIF